MSSQYPRPLGPGPDSQDTEERTSGLDHSSPNAAEVYDVYTTAASYDLDGALQHVAAELKASTLRDRGPPLPSPAFRKGYSQESGLNIDRHMDELRKQVAWLEDGWAEFEVFKPSSVSEARRKDEKRQFGFNAVELIRSGTLQTFPCRRNDLIAPIHPIFQRSNFKNISDEQIYETLIPVFRLASLFLTHPSTRAFWMTVLFGHRDIDHSLSMSRDRVAIRVREYSYTSQDVVKFERCLEELAGTVEFVFRDELYREHSWGRYIGIDPNIGTDVDPWKKTSHVQLMADFYINAAKFARLKHPDEGCRLRFQHFAAVNITHELSHAIEDKVGLVWASTLRRSDPAFFNLRGVAEAIHKQNDFQEAGYAWEHYMFGGRLLPINYRGDGLDGLFVRTTRDSVINEEVQSFSVPMGYVEELQQQSFWDLRAQTNATDAPKVPRIGAVGMILAEAATLPWRDYLLAKEAEQRGALDNGGLLDASAHPRNELRQIYQDLTVVEKPDDTSDPDLDTTSGASSPTSSDPALKDPTALTVDDKWSLFQEFYCLSLNCTSLQFNFKRANGEFSSGLPDWLDPWHPSSWKEPQIKLLVEVRSLKTKPYQSGRQNDPHDEWVKLVSQKWQWVEELIVYNGQSRLELYRQRESMQLDFLTNPEYDPNNANSWGEKELVELREKRESFNRVQQKWTYLEEYVNLRFRMSKDEFLRYKYYGIPVEWKAMDPNDDTTWDEQQLDELKFLRFELSPQQIAQKFDWFKAAWLLSGRDISVLDMTNRTHHGQAIVMGLLKATFLEHPMLDPMSPHSWQGCQISELNAQRIKWYQDNGLPVEDIQAVIRHELDIVHAHQVACYYRTPDQIRAEQEHERVRKLAASRKLEPKTLATTRQLMDTGYHPTSWPDANTRRRSSLVHSTLAHQPEYQYTNITQPGHAYFHHQ